MSSVYVERGDGEGLDRVEALDSGWTVTPNGSMVREILLFDATELRVGDTLYLTIDEEGTA